ncbi:MAG TPA: PmoA family protein [Cyclobacteriaceae bacterium]|nr:PmoA family protein [Cyclobacteriaceae bacterium]
MKRLTLLLCIVPFVTTAQKFAFEQGNKKIDLYYGNALITSFIYFDSLFKTAYYPIATVSGTRITRDYPYVRKAGERTDHPHHVGLFFAHQSVNGHDFWNMSTAIAPAKRKNYGTEKFVSVKTAIKKNTAIINSQADWKLNDGGNVLREKTEMRFSVSGSDLIIDRTTELKALTDVTFKDEKDALLGLRVARELELPVAGKDRFVLENGKESEPMENDITKVTGNYKNSESVIGEAVWGKKATWVSLDGKLHGKDVSVAIIDHPRNVEYPSYWHARGYGLFAVNPLGKQVFTEGKASLDLFLKKGESTTFRYRIVIREGSQLTPAELNQHLKTISEIK